MNAGAEGEDQQTSGGNGESAQCPLSSDRTVPGGYFILSRRPGENASLGDYQYPFVIRLVQALGPSPAGGINPVLPQIQRGLP